LSGLLLENSRIKRIAKKVGKMNKFISLEDAVKLVRDGDTVMVGGFLV
jgi:hypothetical protein